MHGRGAKAALRPARHAISTTSGAGSRRASVATLASISSIAGSIRFATQPASRRPRASIANARQQRVIEATEPHPDDQHDGHTRAARRISSMSAQPESGTSTPPAPSTTTTSAQRREAAVGRRDCVEVDRDAGLRGREVRRDRRGERIGIDVGTAVRRHCPRRRALGHRRSTAAPGAMPAATGFMPTARTPRATSARSSAAATSVLPTPVSVPVNEDCLWVIARRSRSHDPPAVRRGADLPGVAVDHLERRGDAAVRRAPRHRFQRGERALEAPAAGEARRRRPTVALVAPIALRSRGSDRASG